MYVRKEAKTLLDHSCSFRSSCSFTQNGMLLYVASEYQVIFQQDKFPELHGIALSCA